MPPFRCRLLYLRKRSGLPADVLPRQRAHRARGREAGRRRGPPVRQAGSGAARNEWMNRFVRPLVADRTVEIEQVD